MYSILLQYSNIIFNYYNICEHKIMSRLSNLAELFLFQTNSFGTIIKYIT